MTLKKLLLIIAGALGVLGSFLPWYSVSFFGYSQSANAFQMSALYIILAILFIVCSALVITLTAMGEKRIKKMIKIKDAMKITMFTGIAMAIIAAIAFIAIQSESQGLGNVSWGLWFMILASAGVIVLAAIKGNKSLDKVILGEAEKEDSSKKKTAK